MSSVAFGREAAPRSIRTAALRSLLAERGYEIVLGAPILILAAVLLIQLPGNINIDSWLALVTGRLVWDSGVPHHETLTILAQGHAWIDQQWLSQLASYAVYRLGGLGLLGLVNVGLLVSGVAMATFGSRRLGGSFRSVLVALPVCAMLVTPSREVRTQEFAIPLFMLLVYLLARDSRSPSRRVYWCLPILVVWANLHGTVTMGAGLVALHGLLTLWDRRAELWHRPRAWARPLALTAGPLLALLLTPYGLSIIGYYQSTMVNSTLRQAVTEWQPIFTQPTVCAFAFIALTALVWSFWRHPEKTTRWEKVALLLLAVSAISVVRNALFFGLLALLIGPVSLAWGDHKARPQQSPRGALINGLLAVVAVGMLAFATVATFVRPAASFEFQAQRSGVLTAVQRVVATAPSVQIMSDEHFDDWLLWRDPSLAGHIVNDVRFEILTTGQILGLEALFDHRGPHWKLAARGDRLLVLDRKDDHGAFAAFRSEPGAQTLYNDGEREVILRSAAQAARS